MDSVRAALASGKLSSRHALGYARNEAQVKALLAAGANPMDASPSSGSTALHYMLTLTSDYDIEMYLELGAVAALVEAAPEALKCVDGDGQTPLHLITKGLPRGWHEFYDWTGPGAKSKLPRQIKELLLTKGADGSAQDKAGRKASKPVVREGTSEGDPPVYAAGYDEYSQEPAFSSSASRYSSPHPKTPPYNYS